MNQFFLVTVDAANYLKLFLFKYHFFWGLQMLWLTLSLLLLLGTCFLLIFFFVFTFWILLGPVNNLRLALFNKNFAFMNMMLWLLDFFIVTTALVFCREIVTPRLMLLRYRASFLIEFAEALLLWGLFFRWGALLRVPFD